MLSFKATYAIQILDLLRFSEGGRSLSDIRDHFSYLPTRAFVSGLLRQMEVGRLLCNTSLPGTSSRYRIMVGLREISLYDLSLIVDGVHVTGSPIDFGYWRPGYLTSYPHIKEVEQEFEILVREFMESVTIEDILDQREQAGQPGDTDQTSQRGQRAPRTRKQKKVLTTE